MDICWILKQGVMAHVLGTTFSSRITHIWIIFCSSTFLQRIANKLPFNVDNGAQKI